LKKTKHETANTIPHNNLFAGIPAAGVKNVAVFYSPVFTLLDDI
jgi:hypothetical protein